MESVLEPINVSALNQYSYCARRCALIYVENEFANNRHTASGNAEHERVDRAAHFTNSDGARVEYALPIWSERLGLIGKCDVVEFWPDGTIYPVEYKHSARKQRQNDDLQLAAQAMCLEEMFGKAVLGGAIFHAKSKKRRVVVIADELRDAVRETVQAIRQMLTDAVMPPPLMADSRCKECSLIDICQPFAQATLAQHAELRVAMFDPDL